MKKFLRFILSLSIVMQLASCSSDTPSQSSQNQSSSADTVYEASEEETVHAVVVFDEADFVECHHQLSTTATYESSDSTSEQNHYVSTEYYAVEIIDSVVHVLAIDANRVLEARGIQDPNAFVLSFNCGGPNDTAVLTDNGEVYLIEERYHGNSEDNSLTLILHKLETDEKIVSIRVEDDRSLFTTCGAPAYYVTTEAGEVRFLQGNFDRETGQISYAVGELRSVIHPYKQYIACGDTDQLFRNREQINMLYVFEDDTIHLGIADTESEKDFFSDELLRDPSGDAILYQCSFYMKPSFDSKELNRIFILDTQNILYEINNDGQKHQTAERVSSSPVESVELNSEDDRTTHLEIRFENGESFEYDGYVYQRFVNAMYSD